MLVINAISLNMIPRHVDRCVFVVQRVPREVAASYARMSWENGSLDSAVGHEDTARAATLDLGVPIPYSRRTVFLGSEWALVAQYMGTRLPEGATELPPEARLSYFLVKLMYEEDLEEAGELFDSPVYV